MRSVAETIAELLRDRRTLAKPVATPLQAALGRVLAQDIVAPLDVPPADNSAMDGYAFSHADWPGEGQALPISQRIVAGTSPGPLEPRTAARIFTGAGIPADADTVVMQEHCEASDNAVTILKCPDRGANVRPRAQDIRTGQEVLQAGTRLRPQALGLIASLGIPEVRAYRPLKVAVISNGSELVEPGRPVGPGQIYNSNRYMLAGLVAGWGFEPLDFGIVPDEPEAIRTMLERAAAEADVIISSGGVSVGEEDHIKHVVGGLGGIDLWKVSIKPGKPFAFGRVGETPFIGLPGNPSSVLVTCLVIARPYLLACQGCSDIEVSPVKKAALFDHRGGPRDEFLRARTIGDAVECHPRQSSGILMSAVWGDGLVWQKAGEDIRHGDFVDFLPYALLT